MQTSMNQNINSPQQSLSNSLPNKGKLIHIGSIMEHGGIKRYLLLREKSSACFIWSYLSTKGSEEESEVWAATIEEALRLAVKRWKQHYFKTLMCGFRFTLPERDEHGMNALFHQMAASYKSSNGIYYDEELGNNCIVQNASQEALHLLKRAL